MTDAGAPGEWLVDGNNVMGSRPDGWWRDREGARRRLVSQLEAFAAEQDAPVTVIFDGRPSDAGGGDRVSVLFSGRSDRDAADDDIVAVLERHPEPAGVVVATSDARLAERARALGASVHGAGALLRALPG